MAEAIYSRIKLAFLLCLFFLPIVLSMWNRHLDSQIEEVRYLPAPVSLVWADEIAGDLDDPGELADLTDPQIDELPLID